MPAARLVAGRYQLDVPLGRGASGEVWRATDVTMRRPVAVKIVDLGEIIDPELLAETIGRCRREATAVGQLRHPNIVAAYDAGRIGNELYLAMELAPGMSLRQVTEQRLAAGIGLLPITSVLDIAEQVCAGLAAAHAAGVVHRDIKPSNLIVSSRLEVKIIDFGLTRLLADKSPRLTRPAQQLGTLLYVSPEQAAGREVDGRADLYSLGCVLYELVAGEPPFTAELPAALLKMQLIDNPVPLRARRADIPACLELLVGELMAKDPVHRPAGAHLLGPRIAAIRGSLASTGPAQEADRRTVDATDGVQQSHVQTEAARATVLAPDAQRQPARPLEPTRSTVLAPEWQVEPTRPPQQPLLAGGSAEPAARWPAPPPRPPKKRRRWRSAVSTLVTAAILGAVGVILWQRTHDQLKVTAITVAPAQLPGNQCNVTVDVIGTIRTNGRGGQVTYRWIRSGGMTSQAGTVTAASGSRSVTVRLLWTFRGSGTVNATAELRVLTPEVAVASTAFTYSCPG